MTTEDLACHDAACAPPPVGTGGSKPGGPARGHLSPKAGERINQPQAVVSAAYDLKKHGIEEAFSTSILGYEMESDVQWLGENVGWFVEGRLKDSDGESVTYFERYVARDEAGKLFAIHEVLQVEPDYQGKGIAQALNDHLVEWYQKVGVDRIEVTAGLELGPYAWARQGYRIQGVEGGNNRKRWVSDRLILIEQAFAQDDPDLKAQVRALRKASDSGEDVQPIHVASIGQDDPTLHWRDDDFGDMWPGKAVLVEKNYHGSDDRSREWDGVYYLEGKETPATVASALKNLL